MIYRKHFMALFTCFLMGLYGLICPKTFLSKNKKIKTEEELEQWAKRVRIMGGAIVVCYILRTFVQLI